jgi:dTDP-4-dehydrorhamnose reductase
MKIAVTGPNGQLGSALVKQGAIPLRGLLMSEEMTANIETIKPDAIINCAALTDVDYCEKNVLQAAATNTAGMQYLSYRFSGYLIQISTDYVFDGQNGPYGVRDAPSPINIYGWSKLGGELIARRHRGPSLIVRTTILFSSTNNNFVAKIAKQLNGLCNIYRGAKISLYNPDITGTPTYVPALAKEILRIVQAEYEGMAHIVGTPCISRLGFARQIADTFGYDPAVIVPNYDHTDGAERPRKAGLICDHDGYRPIIIHDYNDGLLELSKQKGIYDERPMERMETGRPGSD